MTWTSGPFLGFDTETTGTDASEDRIVTAAVVIRDGRGTDVRTWMIDPGVEIPAAATAVHKITTEQVRAEGREPAGALDEIASVLVAAFSSNVPVVAFNAQFDLSLMEAELARHQLPTLTERLGHDLRPVLDPLVIDRWQDRYRKGRRQLGDLCQHYGVVVDAVELHDAGADTSATLDVLAAMGAKFSTLGELSLDEMHEAQQGSHRQWAEHFGDYLRSKGRTDDLPEPNWPLP